MFSYRDSLGTGVILLTSQNQDRLSYFVGVTKDLVAKGSKAGDLVKAINQAVDGRGGGKPDFAQGGTKAADKQNELLFALKNSLRCV